MGITKGTGLFYLGKNVSLSRHPVYFQSKLLPEKIKITWRKKIERDEYENMDYEPMLINMKSNVLSSARWLNLHVTRFNCNENPNEMLDPSKPFVRL